MRLIDVHCHLESNEYAAGPGPEIEAARRAGVVKLVTAAIVPSQWDLSLELSARFPEVECALGIHPWYIKPEHEPGLDRLVFQAQRGAAAIGEIGLDRRVAEPPIEVQRRFFDSQLIIAKQLNLPVVIHCRAAFNELLDSLRRIGAPQTGGVVHNFSGSRELARDLQRFGLVFSFGGVLTYRNSGKKKELIREIYPDAFVLETDSPDIPPREAPGRPNRPANIVYNLRAAAELLGESEEHVAQATTEVAARVFKLTV
ncbi:MAG: TatD family hydrolase [Candidatus Hydrogenedentes bacterium]|nr:TatD family hydrolase [Candidatus Hydrogenedentota bacterium]